MPRLETARFGWIEYNEDSALEFPTGLPAFEEERRFLLVQQPASRPLAFLQSLRQPGLAFLTLPVQLLVPDYRLALAPEDLASLGFPPDRQPVIGRDIVCLAIVAATAGGGPTANLLAPVVINLKNRHGLQVIQSGSGYSHQHRLAPPGEEGERCW
jgi:flagellar assembly factor FliW